MKAKIRNIVSIPTHYGPADLITFENLCDGKEHIAVGMGAYKFSAETNIRIHSECMTGEILKSSKCDCGEQLDEAMKLFSEKGGIIFYLKQEGRGIGLYNKIDVYGIQNQGFDTVESNLMLGFEDDQRDYSAVIQMLQSLGIDKVNILTNNPKKIDSLSRSGISVNTRVPTGLFLKPENSGYLRTKAMKSGHKIVLDQNLGRSSHE